MIKLSIIIVCFNNPSEVKKTLKSITGKYLEVIVIDGSESPEIKKVCNTSTLKVTLISEKDLGIYDAMNKGISYSTGLHTIFMNSGDYFTEQALTLYLSLNIDEMVTYYGDADFYLNNKKSFAFIANMQKKSNFLKHNCFSHQAIFYSTSALKSIKKYNLNYKISADFDLTWRLFNSPQSRFEKLGFTVANCDLGGISCQKGLQSYLDRICIFYSSNNYTYTVILLGYFPIFYLKNKIVNLLDGSPILASYRRIKSRLLSNV
ncbi:glycosyltransferase [Colwellia sp. E2M01]|uniref:glycosyltransferase n=1 Tax=Colwellia sp. E2M01 TaxID=2841561 RepID=UPI001C0A4D3F|nr:glycosyltransferase [Colwellia sp. E2M01]MBU2869370.1 glycosyltransferase [Colwellia sp. E2M01]